MGETEARPQTEDWRGPAPVRRPFSYPFGSALKGAAQAKPCSRQELRFGKAVRHTDDNPFGNALFS